MTRSYNRWGYGARRLSQKARVFRTRRLRLFPLLVESRLEVGVQ